MDENPYTSPAADDSGERSQGRWRSEPPDWGKLDLIWDLGFLFGSVWFFGSSLMYLALIGLAIAFRGTTDSWRTQPYYDLAGYISFVSCTVIALITGAVLVVKRREKFRQGWPDWRKAGECFVVSTLMMAPAWAIFVGLEALSWMPLEAEWMSIAGVALLGIVHGYVCKRGLRYGRRRGLPKTTCEGPSSTG